MYALASLETLLVARRPPPLLLFELKSAVVSATAALLTVALMRAASTAFTLTSPAAETDVLRRYARVSSGFSPLNALEMSGSPRSASTALKRKFCAFQPIELNASVIANDSSSDSEA